MMHKDTLSLLAKVVHLKHSAIRMEAGGKTLYIDPFKMEGSPKDADIIFVTHAHYDHFSPEDIKNVMKKDAVVVVTADIRENAEKEGFGKVFPVMPGMEYEAGGIRFKTVPAYNIGKKFHPKEKNWVGYIIHADGADYYFAGDTDFIPEMGDIRTDVAFLPVGGTYTMTPEEAVEAANLIKPQVAVPIHFADIVGSEEDAGSFIKGLNVPIQGVILKRSVK